MSPPSLARFGLAVAAAVITFFALAIFFRSRPPAIMEEPLIKELARDTCTAEEAREGTTRVWILENRLVRVKIHSRTAEVLEVLSKESGFKPITSWKEQVERTGFIARRPGQNVYPPHYDSKSLRVKKGASILFEGRKGGIRHELTMLLERNSPCLRIRYTCMNEKASAVRGEILFQYPGRMGETPIDDALIVPGPRGVKKLNAAGAYLYTPKSLHPFRNWFACLDEKTKEMLVVALEPAGDSLDATIISDLTPTGYHYGLACRRLGLEPGRKYSLGFTLTPMNRTLAYYAGDQPWHGEVVNLHRNMDLLLDLPHGPNRILSASWGIAVAALVDPVVMLPGRTTVKIRTRLNRYTHSSPSLKARILLKEHGASQPILEESKGFRLGGAWRSREKELPFPIPDSALHAGRFDVIWAIHQEDDEIFQDRLNLGVAASEIILPPPDLKTARPVERVIARRMSQRVYKDEAIDPGRLSFVLSQTGGLVQDDQGRLRDRMIHASRSRPGGYEIFLHFVHEGAIYRYDKEKNRLVYFKSGNPYFVSELAEEDIRANPRVQTVQAPVLLLIANGGGASDGLFQSFHLAAAAVDLGFCTFGDKSFKWVNLMPGYEEMFYGRLGIPFTPFLFEPKERDLGEENMPQVDAVWTDFAKEQALKDRFPREPEMLDVASNLAPVREQGLTLEGASAKARQVRIFEPEGRLAAWQKSQLLWAAYGRSYLKELQDARDYFDDRRWMFVPGGAHRTVPSACGQYLVDVYMADENGIHRYFGKRHYLHTLRAGDYREEILKLTGTGFENPAALFFFIRRDLLIDCPEGEGYEEAFFAAQNMSLVAAAMDVQVGFARVALPEGDEDERSRQWKDLFGSQGERREVQWVGGEKNLRKGPPVPFAIVAAGPSTEGDIRWWNPEEHPLTFDVPADSIPSKGKTLPPGDGAALSEEVLQSLFPEAEAFAPGDREARYHVAFRRIRKKDGTFERDVKGFAAETSRIAPEIVGYHGTIEMALALTPHGRIRKLKVLHHTETAEHMNRILASGFCEAFEGKTPGELAGVDIVTGATATCSAIARAAQTAQNRLCGTGAILEEASVGEEKVALLKSAFLAGLFAAALCLLRSRRIWRYLVLTAAACLLGLLWNWSFTYTDLLDATGLLGILTAVYVSLVLVSTLLKGRIYCGWICPFGAVQEIAALATSPLRPKRNPGPGIRAPGALRFLKFLVLFLLLAGALITGIKGFLNPEPFTDFFSGDITSWRFFVGVGSAILALVVSRPFCRFLCPTGALLGSLNRLKGSREKRIEFDACRGCGRCVRVCPTKAVEINEEGRILGRNRFECIGCEECVKATEQGACRTAREE